MDHINDLADPNYSTPATTRRQDNRMTYTEDAVLRYRAESQDSLINDPDQILEMVKHHHRHQVPRLQELEQYYLGNNPAIMTGPRRIEENKSDHRVRHSFASTISDFLNSYVLGNPVKMEVQDENEEFSEILDNFNQTNDIHSHNLEIGRDQSNLGRAYEILVQDNQDQTKIYRLDPKEVFLIHDTTVKSRVIAAVRYYKTESYNEDGNNLYTINLYTFNNIYKYKKVDINTGQKLVLEDTEAHKFNGVPIIEYRSDRFRSGVFEKQISLIDAYDAAESDTANYMTDFNDAILVIKGLLKDDTIEDLGKMKDANILVLTPSQNASGATESVEAAYLTKTYDVAGVEAYKTRLKDDIFMFSGVPNFSDLNFGGNQSGVALSYKMYNLQQKKNDKEQFLRKGFRVRYALLENLKTAISEYSGQHATIDYTFTPNLPESYLEELKNFTQAGGTVSNKTKLRLLSFVDNVDQELEKIAEEQEKASLTQRSAWYDDFTDGQPKAKDDQEDNQDQTEARIE
jgi:SPP1 family phage portal protein